MACARWGGDCAAQVAPLARAIESVTVKTLPGGRKEQVGRRGWTPSLPPKREAVASFWAALADDRPLPRCGRGAMLGRPSLASWLRVGEGWRAGGMGKEWGNYFLHCRARRCRRCMRPRCSYFGPSGKLVCCGSYTQIGFVKPCSDPLSCRQLLCTWLPSHLIRPRSRARARLTSQTRVKSNILPSLSPRHPSP